MLNGDNVFDVAGRRRNRQAAREIVAKIAELDEAERASKMEQLMVLASLRLLGPVQEEASHMPITENILGHEIISTAFKKRTPDDLLVRK